MGYTGFVTRPQIPTGDRRLKHIRQHPVMNGRIRVYLSDYSEIENVVVYMTTCLESAGGEITDAVWTFDVIDFKVEVEYGFKEEVYL